MLIGGIIGGALGWYFDQRQIAVVADKLRAYADLSFAASGRPVSSYVIYPLFSKWGVMDLGQVGGGISLFFTESLSGVINWSLAAPLFGINYVLLAALIERSLRPLRQLFSQEGLDGLVVQTVRVLRWGLWMAPVIFTFLKASPDPAWYNQDGAVRTVVATIHSLTMSGTRLPHVEPRRLHRPPCLRLAAHPHLVRPYGHTRRDPRQSHLRRRRQGG